MKRVIWSSEEYYNKAARREHEAEQRELLEDAGFERTYRQWCEEVDLWLDDERTNLNREVDGVIIAFGDIGTWRGRRQGYQIIGSCIANILKASTEEAEWYGDGHNIRATMPHHDGTNYALYRVAMNREDAERIAEKIYCGEIDEAGFRRRTRSLYPYVAAVYGWPSRQPRA